MITDINIYDLDTNDIILKRLAAKNNTLVEYLYFPSGTPTNFTDIKVENLLDYLINYSEYNDIEKLYKQLSNKLSQNKLNFKSDIFEVFIAFNTHLSKVNVDTLPFILNIIQDNIDKLQLSEKINVKTIFDERKTIKQKINKEILKNKIYSSKIVESYKELERIKNKNTFIDFIKTHSEINIVIKNNLIGDLFNSLIVSQRTPFASYNTFYKMVTNFIIPDNWNISLKDLLIVKTNINNNIFKKTYTDVFLKSEEDNILLTFSIKIDEYKYLKKDKIIENILNSFSLQKNNIKVNQMFSSGLYYITNIDFVFNYSIASDILLNNNLFRNYITINDSNTSKIFNNLYIYFNNNISANIKEKTSLVHEVKKFGKHYIRIRIRKASSLKDIQIFIKYINKFFQYYRENYKKLEEYYRQFLPKFKLVRTETQYKKLKLKNIAPDIFPAGYSKMCLHKPTIISDEEAKVTKQQVMRYPVHTSNIKPRNFICNHEKHIYPALKPNVTQSELKYLPCCYITDHSERKGTLYRKYFFGEEKEQTPENYNISKRNKFLTINNYGYLQQNILNVLKLIDSGNFVRLGMSDNQSTLLECVLVSIGIISKNMTELSRIAKVEKERNALMSIASSGKQEFYRITTENISNFIKNKDLYMNPLFFIPMLEMKYKINIYVFKKIKGKIEMVIPNNIKGYYQNKNNYEYSIIVYEHCGDICNENVYKCELITKQIKDNVFEMRFANNKKISKLFDKTKQFYVVNKKQNDTELPDFKNMDLTLTHQSIDSYGKTRILHFLYKGKPRSILISPIQPLTLKSKKLCVEHKFDKDIALQFIKESKLSTVKQIVNCNNILLYINCSFKNIEINIPMKKSNPLPEILTVEEYSSLNINCEISLPEIFRNYTKLSRYILEYVYWLYSIYITKNDIINIQDFINKNIVIDKSFNYGKLKPILTLENKSIMKNKKLVVHSQKIIDRLMYNLRLFSNTNFSKLIDYHKKKFLDNFYTNLSDFEQKPNQIIIKGDSITEKINKSTKLTLSSKILPRVNTPYFFKNKLIGDKMYLCMNTDNIESALNRSITWKSKGYNDIDETLVTDKFSYTLYRYVSETNIKSCYIQKDIEYGISIIGYKIDSVPKFSILLET